MISFAKPKLVSMCIAVSCLIGALSTPAFADTQLVLSSWLPPRHPLVVNAIKPWAKQVEDVTEGRVSVRVLSKPLGPPPAHYDIAVDAVADITYGLHSFTKDDRFLRSRIGQFSFIGNEATSTSKAYWSVYTTMLDAQQEHQGVKLLSLFVHGPGAFHNNVRRIETPDDFKGLKIRTPGGYIADLSSDLGITTQFMGPGDVYEKLSRGVIDGVTFPSEGLLAFKLTDYLRYSMNVPGGMYNTSWFLVMNSAKWDSLSAADQQAIMDISGEAFAELAGQVWDEADARGVDYIAKSDIEVYEAPPSVIDAIRTIADKYESQWAQAVSETGDFDGIAALRELRRLSGIEPSGSAQ